MQVRVNPNHVFKRMIRAWLKRWICLAVWAASRSFKRAKVLNADLIQKKRGSRILPQSSPHMNVYPFSLKIMTKQGERYCLTNIFQMV